MKMRRRRVPRQAAGWFGKCLLEDDPHAVWAECRVVDISVLGAGIEVFGSTRPNLVGQRLGVEVQPASAASLSIHFVGEIKNVAAAPRGRVRLGMEFIDLTDSERSFVQVLEQMRMAW
jgi:hypothetical protein